MSESSYRIKLGYSAFTNFLTCKNLDLEQYRILLLFTFCLNALSFAMEVVHMVVLFIEKDLVMAMVSLIATILTCINCSIVLKIIAYPSTRLALTSSAIILVLEVVYIAQCVVEADTLIRATAVVFVTSIMLALHFCTAFLLYRYWEFVMYHYDESNGLQTFVNNFPPDSFISPQDVMSQLHSPLVDTGVEEGGDRM